MADRDRAQSAVAVVRYSIKKICMGMHLSCRLQYTLNLIRVYRMSWDTLHYTLIQHAGGRAGGRTAGRASRAR